MRISGSKSNNEKSKDESGDDKDTSTKSKSTINLVAVDGQRIGRFST